MFAINEDDSVTEYTSKDCLTGKRFKAVILTLEDVQLVNKEWLLNSVLIRACGSANSVRHSLNQGTLCTGQHHLFEGPLVTSN